MSMGGVKWCQVAVVNTEPLERLGLARHRLDDVAHAVVGPRVAAVAPRLAVVQLAALGVKLFGLVSLVHILAYTCCCDDRMCVFLNIVQGYLKIVMMV